MMQGTMVQTIGLKLEVNQSSSCKLMVVQATPEYFVLNTQSPSAWPNTRTALGNFVCNDHCNTLYTL